MTSLPVPTRETSNTRAAIVAAAEAHERAFRARILDFSRRAERLYADELDAFVERYRSDLALRPFTDLLFDEARNYLYWMRWVGWNATNLIALCDADDDEALARDFSQHLAAYAALRFVDDGLDGHRSYKDVRSTLVTFIEAQHSPAADRAEAYSVFLGMCVFNFALQRIAERSPQGAASVARLLDRASVGVIGEGCTRTIRDESAYEQLARRKAGAYNLMLYLPFLRTLALSEQQPLRAVLVDMDVLAQLINDLRDDPDDRQRRQPSAVDVYKHGALAAELARRVEALWSAATAFPSPRREALAALFSNLDLEVLADDTDPVP